MSDSIEIVRAWWRQHGDGSRGSVGVFADGTLSGGTQQPLGIGITGGPEAFCRSLDQAQAIATQEAERAGHACGPNCGPWVELVIGTHY